MILAAVYAQAGRFRAAVIATERAMELASASGETRLAADLERQLELYQGLARSAAPP